MDFNAEPIVALHQVSFIWPGSRQFALNVDNFTLYRGERVLLLGHSGSGKSTLLSLLCGVITPQQGTVTLAGTNLASLSVAKRDRFRAENVGVIFQQFNLLPYGSVADNVLLPLAFAPKRRQRVEQGGDGMAEAQRLCKALQLPNQILSARTSELSVGQQQRVAVARALIGQPAMIIADEPTSALDRDSQQAFMNLLLGQVADSDASLLMVSHDPSLADYFDRVVRIEDLQTAIPQAEALC
ncbi:MAG: ABC transporter ATP-binding protein [Gammaproteobacteria bacterium]|nr:ABC transporter ATP-binding protein [Gammaproteobacteria bacterium]